MIEVRNTNTTTVRTEKASKNSVVKNVSQLQASGETMKGWLEPSEPMASYALAVTMYKAVPQEDELLSGYRRCTPAR